MLAAHRQFAGDVRGERGLADAAFLVEQRDDHGAALRAGKPGFPAVRWPCRFSVVHRNGASTKSYVFLVREVRGAAPRRYWLSGVFVLLIAR
jgi:hypothetical protein